MPGRGREEEVELLAFAQQGSDLPAGGPAGGEAFGFQALKQFEQPFPCWRQGRSSSRTAAARCAKDRLLEAGIHLLDH